MHLVLPLISCLLTPIGASILGRCVVAKRLQEGGLDYFEGYSLENCEWDPCSPSILTSLISVPCPATLPCTKRLLLTPLAVHLLGVCLAYFESKFNPSAMYENSQGGYTGFGLFQIRDSEWCDHGRNLCSASCSGGSPPSQGTAGCRAYTCGEDWRRELAWAVFKACPWEVGSLTGGRRGRACQSEKGEWWKPRPNRPRRCWDGWDVRASLLRVGKDCSFWSYVAHASLLTPWGPVLLP